MKDQLEKIEKRLACIEENTRLLLLSDVMRELDKSTDTHIFRPHSFRR